MAQANYSDTNPGSPITKGILFGVAPNGVNFDTIPIKVVENLDGTGSLALSSTATSPSTEQLSLGGTLVSSTNPLPIIGSVGGKTAIVEITPVVTAASAYATNNVVGGVLTLNSALLSAQSGVIQSIRLRSKSSQLAGFRLYIFRSIPTTVFTDHAAPAINQTDIAFIVDTFVLASPDSSLGTYTFYSLNTSSSVVVATSTTLYGVLITTGTPTFTTTSDLTLSIGILQD